MIQKEEEQSRVWRRAEVEEELRAILVESLGIQPDEVTPSASLVRDLGAESIDFLDMSFQIQQVFGVNIQAAEIRDRIIAWGSLVLPALSGLLTERYGVRTSPEELRPLEGGGLEKVLDHFRTTQGIPVDGTAVDEIGQELLRRLLKEFAGIGFDVSDGDREDLLTIMRSNLGTRRITERTLDLLTFGTLVSFICGKLGPRLHPN